MPENPRRAGDFSCLPLNLQKAGKKKVLDIGYGFTIKLIEF